MNMTKRNIENKAEQKWDGLYSLKAISLVKLVYNIEVLNVHKHLIGGKNGYIV